MITDVRKPVRLTAATAAEAEHRRITHYVGETGRIDWISEDGTGVKVFWPRLGVSSVWGTAELEGVE